MEAIKNKDILLIQAGVGIGKSFGYLLPIFHTHNNVKSFDKIIISTSSIALQEQLLNDIKNISFSTSFKGYKQDEVEAFLDKIESEYVNIECVISDYKFQI